MNKVKINRVVYMREYGSFQWIVRKNETPLERGQYVGFEIVDGKRDLHCFFKTFEEAKRWADVNWFYI